MAGWGGTDIMERNVSDVGFDHEEKEWDGSVWTGGLVLS